MDLTRDRPSVRAAEDLGRGDGKRSGGPGEPWRYAQRHAAFAAAAPATAADVIIDLPSRPDLPIRPVSGVGETSDSLAGVAAAGPARARRKRVAIPVSLGAVAALALAVAAILVRPELVAESAPAAAVAPQVAAEPAAVAEATIHLRVAAGLSPEERQRIRTALANAGYGTVVMHEMPFSVSRTRVGYFREADRPSAEALIAALRGVLDGIELRDYRTLIETPEPGRLDLWIRS